MKRIFTLIVAVICVINLSGQSTKTDAMLFGDVKNKNTGGHIPFVTITVKGTNLGTLLQ